MKKIISFFVLISFIFSCIMPPQGFAQSISAVGLMPLPGTMATLTPAFTPAHLRGMVIYPNDPFKFDFIVHRGDELMTSAQKQEEYSKLIKYFLAALAIPDKDQWVNLSPYEKDRIIPDDYGLTEMGRDVLAQDYMLKQISASLTNPDTDLGKKFWDAVYAKSYQKFGTTDIPSDTFNKVWIMPDRAVIFEKGSAVVVLEHHLKVMLESDYRAMQENGLGVGETENDTKAARISKDVMREVILPAIEKEVNEGRNFAPLRQIHNSMLLAAWYKRALKESILNKVYGDKSKVKGIDQDPQANQEIYEKYTTAFRKGAFNMIREDVSRFSQEVIPRKYFSGGDMAMGLVYDNAHLVIKVKSSKETAENVVKVFLKADVVETSFNNVADNSQGNNSFDWRNKIKRSILTTSLGVLLLAYESAVSYSAAFLQPDHSKLPLGMMVVTEVLINSDISDTFFLQKGIDNAVLFLDNAQGNNLFDWRNKIKRSVKTISLGLLLLVYESGVFYSAAFLQPDHAKLPFGMMVATKILANPEVPETTISQTEYQLSLADAKMILKELFLGNEQALNELQDPNMQSRAGLLLFTRLQMYAHPEKSSLLEPIMTGLLREGDLVWNAFQAKQMLKVLFAKDDKGLTALNDSFVQNSEQGLLFFIGDQWVQNPWIQAQLGEIVTGLSANAVYQKVDNATGGIDFAQANLNMQIRRDGKGVPLPVSQQNLDNIRIDGLVPVILNIQSAVGVPLFTEAGGLAASAA